VKPLRLRQAVSLQAEAMYGEPLALAARVGPVFAKQREDGAGRGQFHRFEAVVCSAERVGVILDHVKRQAARLRAWRESGLADEFLCWVNEKLPGHTAEVRRRMGEDLSPEEELTVKLLLVQEYVRALVAQVEFDRTKSEVERS